MTKIMCFDVGGTEIKYSVIDESLQIFDEGYVPTPTDTQEHFFQVLNDIYQPHKDEVDGIAMSLPGFIDTEKGRCNGGGALIYNWNSDVGPGLEAVTGCKVHLENDGKCAALAEYWQGALQGVRNGAVFIIGTAVGGGLIIDGKLVKGIHSTAGEFSFVILDADVPGTLNSSMAGKCSTRSLLNFYREFSCLPPTYEIDGRELFKRLEDGDINAQKALDRLSYNIALQVFNLSALLDLEVLAIGGGISKQPILTETIRRKLNELKESTTYNRMIPVAEVVTCKFSSQANQIGAMYAYLLAENKL